MKESCISLLALEEDVIQISVWNSLLPMATANALVLYVGLTSNIVSRSSLGSVIIRALNHFCSWHLITEGASFADTLFYVFLFIMRQGKRVSDGYNPVFKHLSEYHN